MRIATQGGEFQGMLKVGTPAFVNVQGRGRYRTAVRGWREGQEVILDCPVFENLPLALMRNEICVVRFIAEGNACAFQTAVLGKPTRELPCFPVAWPEEVETVQVRRHERVDVAAPCTVTAQDAAEVLGRVCDLSQSGCKLYAHACFPVSAVLTLSFTLPNGVRLDQVQAIVRRVHASGRGSLLGCEFQELPEGLREGIELFVADVVNTRRKSLYDEGDGLRVLIVRQRCQRATALAEVLNRLGCTTVVAEGAVDGFHQFQRNTPHIVLITDDQEELAPLDICRAMKHARKEDNLIVMVCGNKPPEDMAFQLQSVGGDRYLTCPATPEEVADCVLARATEGRPAASES